MIRIFCLSACLLIAAAVVAQLNVTFVSQLEYPYVLNDIWGYTADDSTEYALVGTTHGLSIVSLEDPANPREIQFIDGIQSTWRDMKTWGHFAYTTTDNAPQGLLITDLSTLPDSVEFIYWRPDLPDLGVYNSAHNLYIDEIGLMYLAGTNRGGLLVFDVKENPWEPEFLVQMPVGYAHDVYARDSIVYSSEIFAGELRIYDIRRLDSIVLLGSVKTPHEFTHNAWLSDDSKTVFTTDERANAFIAAYDLTDLPNIRELDRFRPARTVGLGVIPHNVHVFDEYLVISYYTDGCIIVDAARPDNLIEVGNYDTYPGPHGGFNGSWGAYPFLPSGLVLMSDRQYGLYVLEPHYTRACYLEGSVRDSETLQPITNVRVGIIISDPADTMEVLLPQMTDLQGVFKTGKAVPGNYEVSFSHPAYFPKTIAGDFINGEVLEMHITLDPRPRHDVSGRVVREGSVVLPVPHAFVALDGPDFLYTTQADADGIFQLAGIVEGQYAIYAGTWGQFVIDTLDVSSVIHQDILVHPGYYDDFLFDLGWSVSGTSTGAHWERGVPHSQLIFNAFQCNPAADVDGDFGNSAYMTGNAAVGNAANNNVNNGYTLLSSPVMDLSAYLTPVLRFTPWLCQRLTDRHVYFVLLSDGQDTVVIDTVINPDIQGSWMAERAINLSDFMTLNDAMQVHFLAVDTSVDDNIVKAAVDLVSVLDEGAVSVKDVIKNTGQFRVFPNPSSGVIHIQVDGSMRTPAAVRIFDITGRQVFRQLWPGSSHVLTCTPELPPGLYLIRLEGDADPLAVRKVVIR